MFVPQILVSAPRSRLLAAGLLVVLAGCGQKGPLFLPTGDVAAGRATLPETLAPSTGSGTAVVPTTAASGLPPSGTVSPVRP
jgi:predicted small lipoprotein YifL